MKHLNRILALTLALCLCLLPSLSLADTYLPEGEVTHTDFTLDFALHADAFPASAAHLSDWEAFLGKLDLRGSMNSLAMLTDTSRVYLDGALRLNGKDQVPFVYDGYHSYRYLVSPALNNQSLHFQMHNFFEFMLKPYYYMELPTQYLALLMYPEAAYWIGSSYYTPVAQMIAEAEPAEAAQTDETESSLNDVAVIGGADGPTSVLVTEGSTVKNVPYSRLYELCEELDMLVNDDYNERVYFFFTALLAQLYANDTTVDALAYLEDWLDFLDPEQNGMTIVESADSMTCIIGEYTIFTKTTDGDAVSFSLSLPNADGYTLDVDYEWTPNEGSGAALLATLAIRNDGADAVKLTFDGSNLPREGDLNGKGAVTLGLEGSSLSQTFSPLTFTFDWTRDAAEKPYTLDLKVDLLHPATGLAALSAHFNGTLSVVDRSVFVEQTYPQDDFFHLNEGFLAEYKQTLLPTLTLSVLPIVLEMPSGVLNDLYSFCDSKGILLSLGIE